MANEMTPQRRREILSNSPTGRGILADENVDDATMILSEGDAGMSDQARSNLADMKARRIIDKLVEDGIQKLEGKGQEFLYRIAGKTHNRPAGDLRGRLITGIIERMRGENLIGKVGAKGNPRKIRPATDDDIKQIVLSEIKKLWQENPPGPAAELEKILVG